MCDLGHELMQETGKVSASGPGRSASGLSHWARGPCRPMLLEVQLLLYNGNREEYVWYPGVTWVVLGISLTHLLLNRQVQESWPEKCLITTRSATKTRRILAEGERKLRVSG